MAKHKNPISLKHVFNIILDCANPKCYNVIILKLGILKVFRHFQYQMLKIYFGQIYCMIYWLKFVRFCFRRWYFVIVFLSSKCLYGLVLRGPLPNGMWTGPDLLGRDRCSWQLTIHNCTTGCHVYSCCHGYSCLLSLSYAHGYSNSFFKDGRWSILGDKQWLQSIYCCLWEWH